MCGSVIRVGWDVDAQPAFASAGLHWNFMAKFKPAGSKKTAAKSARSAIPCLVLVVLGIVIMCLLFYYSLQSTS